jgi:hypothetical protein
LPTFKIGRHCASGFSKEKCSPETNLAVLRTGKIGPGQFSKTLGAAPRNILPNRSRRFELTGFEKLSVNSSIAYYFNIKFKARFKFFLNICQTLS